MITDINSEDRLVQKTFADHLRDALGWESVYAYNEENLGPSGTLGRANERGGAPVTSISSITSLYQQDAPPCPHCGAIMIRSGACYKCLNCGAVNGCS